MSAQCHPRLMIQIMQRGGQFLESSIMWRHFNLSYLVALYLSLSLLTWKDNSQQKKSLGSHLSAPSLFSCCTRRKTQRRDTAAQHLTSPFTRQLLHKGYSLCSVTDFRQNCITSPIFCNCWETIFKCYSPYITFILTDDLWCYFMNSSSAVAVWNGLFAPPVETLVAAFLLEL